MLSPKDYQRLRPHLRHVPLAYRPSLHPAHRRPGSVYFIETGVNVQLPGDGLRTVGDVVVLIGAKLH